MEQTNNLSLNVFLWVYVAVVEYIQIYAEADS